MSFKSFAHGSGSQRMNVASDSLVGLRVAAQPVTLMTLSRGTPPAPPLPLANFLPGMIAPVITSMCMDNAVERRTVRGRCPLVVMLTLLISSCLSAGRDS